tara:strand:- start:11828 stop:12655 length:828 start_codon:yes stop_codon:yes gene_type:complete
MSFEFTGAYGLPSIQTALETVENVFWWGRFEQEAFVGSVVIGSARDAGNSGDTTVLRPGLLLGKITASGKLKEWNPTGTDGSQNIYGVLGYSQKMTRLGSNADRWLGWVYCWGFLKADRILVPGQADFGISGNANEHIIRKQLGNRFTFSDKLEGYSFGGYRDVVAKTASYVVTEADHDTLFTNRGAAGEVVFTLPATAEKGLSYTFYCVADQNLKVTAGTADTMVTANDAAADSVSWETSTEKIGGGFSVYGDGTSWLTVSHSPQTGHTVTIAT